MVLKSVFDQVGFVRPDIKTFPVDTYHYVLLFGTYGPCVFVKKPITVAYRHHPGNAILNVERMVKAIDFLVEAERLGIYLGGCQRRFSRYVIIGGAAISWIRIAFQNRLFPLALRGLTRTFPMVLAALARGILKPFRPRIETVRLRMTDPVEHRN